MGNRAVPTIESKPVKVRAVKVSESPVSIQLVCNDHAFWLPKGLVKDNGDNTFTMPDWLAKEHGLA